MTGQRYDIVVNADQPVGDYWMRAVPQSECSSNNNSADIRAIIRYDGTSTADPTSTAYEEATNNLCDDMPYESLVPYLPMDVINPVRDDSELDVGIGINSQSLFKWKIGTESMLVKWADPSLYSIMQGNTTFEAEEVVYNLPTANQWIYFVIETAIAVPHPIHLHGHDYFVLAEARNAVYNSSVPLNLKNPPRRDVVNLPTAGYMVMAFYTDNPGAWLVSDESILLPLFFHPWQRRKKKS